MDESLRGPPPPPFTVPFPNKLRVGVFAESMAPGSFAPVFDQFALTPLK